MRTVFALSAEPASVARYLPGRFLCGPAIWSHRVRIGFSYEFEQREVRVAWRAKATQIAVLREPGLEPFKYGTADVCPGEVHRDEVRVRPPAGGVVVPLKPRNAQLRPGHADSRCLTCSRTYRLNHRSALSGIRRTSIIWQSGEPCLSPRSSLGRNRARLMAPQLASTSAITAAPTVPSAVSTSVDDVPFWVCEPAGALTALVVAVMAGAKALVVVVELLRVLASAIEPQHAGVASPRQTNAATIARTARRPLCTCILERASLTSSPFRLAAFQRILIGAKEPASSGFEGCAGCALRRSDGVIAWIESARAARKRGRDACRCHEGGCRGAGRARTIGQVRGRALRESGTIASIVLAAGQCAIASATERIGARGA